MSFVNKVNYATRAIITLVSLGFASNILYADETRQWETSSWPDSIVATDCRECGDDIGMMLTCKKTDEPISVTVHWAAVENGTDNAELPIKMMLDDKVFTYQAKSILFGQIGYTPVFNIKRNDPLINALQKAKTINILFAGGKTDISLKGSRAALEKFKHGCNRVQ